MRFLPRSRRQEYVNYRATQKWREKREDAIIRSHFLCALCGRGGQKLNVHHVRYPEVFGEERPQDLVALCSRCHILTHKHLDAVHRDELYDALPQSRHESSDIEMAIRGRCTRIDPREFGVDIATQ